MGRKHPFLSLLVVFPNLLSLISSRCFEDYNESSQPTNVTLTSSPPVMMDGRLHYCDSNQQCSITCTNRNDNGFGVSPYFDVDDECLALSDIRNKSGFSVLENGVVNTTIGFPCSSVGAIRCVFGNKHFSAMIRITKDKECVNRSTVISSSQTDSPVLVPGPPLNDSTPFTAPTSTTSTPIGPTKEDNLEPSVNTHLVPAVTLPIIIALLVGILVVVLGLLIVIYKKPMKFGWKRICQRQLSTPDRSEEEDNPEPDDRPNLDQDQVAVSIGNQEQEVLPIPVEEEHLPLGIGRRNEVPDGRDEDAELGLLKPVQATDD